MNGYKTSTNVSTSVDWNRTVTLPNLNISPVYPNPNGYPVYPPYVSPPFVPYPYVPAPVCPGCGRCPVCGRHGTRADEAKITWSSCERNS